MFNRLKAIVWASLIIACMTQTTYAFPVDDQDLSTITFTDLDDVSRTFYSGNPFDLEKQQGIEARSDVFRKIGQDARDLAQILSVTVDFAQAMQSTQKLIEDSDLVAIRTELTYLREHLAMLGQIHKHGLSLLDLLYKPETSPENIQVACERLTRFLEITGETSRRMHHLGILIDAKKEAELTAEFRSKKINRPREIAMAFALDLSLAVLERCPR